MKKLLFLFILNIFIFFITPLSWANTHDQITDSTIQLISPILPFNPKIISGKLSNGLQYYILKNSYPKNRVELRLVVKAGSILEHDDQLGVAHIVEHLAFNGTEHFKKQQIVDFLERNGVNFGADLNAYTSFDETVYELQIPTDNKTLLDTSLQILEDWAHGQIFDTAELSKERKVVLEEWRLGRNVDARVRDKFLPILLQGSQYAKRLPIGTPESIQHTPIEKIKDFYKNWYRPDLEAVIVVGDINVDTVQKKITTLFNKLKNPLKELPKLDFSVPAHSGTRVSVVTDSEQTYNVIEVFYKLPKIPEPLTDTAYRASIVRNLFNTMITGRFQDLQQNPDAPFVFAGCNYDRLLGDNDALVFTIVAKSSKNLIPSLDTVTKEVDRLMDYGFSEPELTRAKASLMANIEQSYKEQNKTPSVSLVQELIRHFLVNEAVPGVDYEYHLYQKYLPTITIDNANKLLASWIRPFNRVVVVLAPASETNNLPDSSTIMIHLDSVYRNLGYYNDNTPNGPILPQQPTPGSITAEKKYKDIGVTVLTLSNGAEVVLKPTNFKNDEILISAIAPGGTSLSDTQNYISANFSDNIVAQSGVGRLDYGQLLKKLAGKNLAVTPYIESYQKGILASSSVTDLQTTFQLITAYFVDPRKDVKGFAIVHQQLATDLVNRSKDPAASFDDSIQYAMGNYNFRTKPFTIDRLPELNFDRAYEFYKKQFSDAGNFIFTIVGNFNIDSIKPFVKQYLASLPSTPKHLLWHDNGIRPPTGDVNKIFYSGKEKRTSVRIIYSGMAPYTPTTKLGIIELCEGLSIQLRDVLREEQGGVYGVSVYGNYSHIPANLYNITISFVCAPENYNNLLNLTYKMVDSVKTHGLDSVVIGKVKAEALRNIETQLATNAFWRAQLQERSYFRDNLLNINKIKKDYSFIQVANSKKMADQYFNKNRATFILLPNSYKK
ncbi:MAG: insulinase family protein [Phycisphaerales bacterium]|nr:insulinase family protein [Phycisphaerales bacterium]